MGQGKGGPKTSREADHPGQEEYRNKPEDCPFYILRMLSLHMKK